MPGTNVSIGQITVNVNDIIPPDNFATVDAGTKIGTVYTKEQDNAWRKEVEENTTSGIKGVAKPNDTIPATGFFRMLANTAATYTNYLDVNDAPIVVTDADLNVVSGVQRNEVVIEVNNGISEKKVFAKVGADGANGTATIPQWVAGDYSPDAMVIYEFVQYITPDGADAIDVPGESDKWVKIGGDLELDVSGSALGYDTFLNLAGVPVNPGTVSYNGSDFNVVGGYGDEGNGVMAFHPEYTGSRSTSKIKVHKDAKVEIKSVTNNVSLPIRIPVLTVLAADQTTIIAVVLNSAVDSLETHTYTATENCYVVASVANVSFLPQIELNITSFTGLDLPTKVLTAENYKDFLSEKTLKEKIINGDTPTEVQGLTSQRNEANIIEFKGKTLFLWSEGWNQSIIKVGDYDVNTNTVSNITTAIDSTISGISAPIFKCPTTFVLNQKVYLVISVWNPNFCILYESNDGRNYTEVSRTLADVAGFDHYGNHWIITEKINGFYHWYIEGNVSGIWDMKLLRSTQINTGWELVGTVQGLNQGAGAKGGPCVIKDNGKFKMIYHYGPSAGNLPTYIAYAEADVNDPLYFKAFYLPLMTITQKPFGNLTDQYADPELCEIGGKTYLFCSVVDNTTPRATIYRWECDGRLYDILNSKI